MISYSGNGMSRSFDAVWVSRTEKKFSIKQKKKSRTASSQSGFFRQAASFCGEPGFEIIGTIDMHSTDIDLGTVSRLR